MGWFSGDPTTGNMNGQSVTQPTNDVPWMMTAMARTIGTVAGLVSLFFGFLDLFTSILSISCMFAGGILLVEGMLISLIEAPCFCTFLDFAYAPSTFINNKPHWIKATLYLCLSMTPLFWCYGFTVLMACGLMFLSSAFYLVIALGKKASVEEMRQKANQQISSSPSAVLVHNEELPKATLPIVNQQAPSYPNTPFSYEKNQTPVY